MTITLQRRTTMLARSTALLSLPRPRAASLGPTLALFLAPAAATQGIHHLFVGVTNCFGQNVAGAGDVDGDGYDDVICGEPCANGNRGLFSVRSGRFGSGVFGLGSGTVDEMLGTAVAGAGDVNGDGMDDVIVGAGGFGSAYVKVFTRNGASGTPTTLYTFTRQAADTAFGWDLAGVGDVNQDGYDDVAVGAGNSVRIYSGRTGGLLRTLAVECTDLARAGDVDGDGYDDVLVGSHSGSPFSAGSPGQVRVFSGRTGGVLRLFQGDSASDFFGRSVSGGADIDGDGVPDVVVGAPGDDDNGSLCGSVRALSGNTGAILFTRYGDVAGDLLGQSVALVGDMDGDGRAEFAAGAPGDVGGYVHVYGSNGALLFTPIGCCNGRHMGTSVAAAGDVNADGRADLAAGSPHDNVATPGNIVVFQRTTTADPGRFEDYGRGCAGSDLRLPRFSFAGRPSLGRSTTASVYAAPRSAPGILRLAAGRNELDLGFLGMPGCLLLTQFALDIGIGTDASGRASLRLAVPNDPALAGAAVDLQWTVVDRAANAMGLVTSDGGEVTIGRG